MGRSKNNSYRLTVDVHGDNYDCLKELTEIQGIKYGPLVNKIIRTFCLMPKNVKKTLEKALLAELKWIDYQLQYTHNNHIAEFHKHKLVMDKNYILDMLNLMNRGVYKSYSEYSRYELLDGYVDIPQNWVAVNKEDASRSRYVVVLYTKCKAYGVPYFIYFTNVENESNYKTEIEADFLDKCRKVCPEFVELEKQVNENSPDIPFFGLYKIHDKGYITPYEQPFGLMIERNGEK